jgi:hypothetical protein
VGDGPGNVIAAVLRSVGDPNQIAVDPASGKLYIAQFDTGNVGRANVNGSGDKAIFAGLNEPEAVAVNSGAGALYTCLGNGGGCRPFETRRLRRRDDPDHPRRNWQWGRD